MHFSHEELSMTIALVKNQHDSHALFLVESVALPKDSSPYCVFASIELSLLLSVPRCSDKK